MQRPALLDPLAGSVREILSGRRDGRSQVAAAIAKPSGQPGWFTPADPIWTVHGSVATFVGGIRALFLQSLHPLALAGVNQHSRYRDDPFGRLQRTGAFIAATTFGGEDLASATVSAVARLHEHVAGTAPDGRQYRASDPRLLTWVHVTLTDSMLAAYARYGRDGAVDFDGYVYNMSVVGAAMGVDSPPTTVEALRSSIADFDGELASDDATARMKQFVAHPPLPVALRPGYAVLAAGAIDLLEPRHRALLGEPAHSALARGSVRASTDALLRLLRTALVESPARAAGEQRLGLQDGYQRQR